MPNAARRWTPDEVRAMQDESWPWPRFELIDGELLVTPGPSRLHQRAVAELFLLLHPYIQEQGIGVAELSPADIELEPGTITQPDVFVSPLINGRAPLHWSETTRLLLAAEVISPSNARHDRVIKRRFFTRVDVEVYWVVDLDARIVERNVGPDPRPEILDETLSWDPAGASRRLLIDLPGYFARVHAEGSAT